MTIFCYCSPHLHWEDKTHTELIVSPRTGDSHWFPLFFSKNRNALFNWQIRLPSLPRWGYPKAFWVSRNVVISLIAYHMVEQEKVWSQVFLWLGEIPTSGLLSAVQYSETSFSTEAVLSPQGFDADLWQLLMGEYSVMASFISHYLQRERPI